MKKLLMALALLVVSSPLYAQSAPVQVICAKGTYKPACSGLKQAINQSPVWHQTKKGPRYVVVIVARRVAELPTLIYGSASFAANLEDPLSSHFPYLIDGVGFAVGTTNVSALGPALVGMLTDASIAFAATLESLNKYGTAGPDLQDVDELPMRFLTDADLVAPSDE